MERPSAYMVSMLLSAAAPLVFSTVFWDWCYDTIGIGAAVGCSVVIGVLKVYDVLVLSIAWKKAKEALRNGNHGH